MTVLFCCINSCRQPHRQKRNLRLKITKKDRHKAHKLDRPTLCYTIEIEIEIRNENSFCKNVRPNEKETQGVQNFHARCSVVQPTDLGSIESTSDKQCFLKISGTIPPDLPEALP